MKRAVRNRRALVKFRVAGACFAFVLCLFSAITLAESRMVSLDMQRGDTKQVQAKVTNYLHGPIEIELFWRDNKNMSAMPALPLRKVLPPNRESTVSILQPIDVYQASSYDVQLRAVPGDPRATPDDMVYAFPLALKRTVMGQGFSGKRTHQDDQNRYAVDLNAERGTSVLAARSGVVMEVVDGHGEGGFNSRFTDKANLVRVVHADGTMAVYVHLLAGSIQVQPGQRVAVGQRLASSGNSGYSSGPHLHFGLQMNVGMKLVSIPFRMLGPEGMLKLESP